MVQGRPEVKCSGSSSPFFILNLFHKHWRAGLLLLPAVATILVWAYIPLVRGAAMAFYDYRIFGASTWVFLDNFANLLWDADWWRALLTSARYSVLVISMTFLPPVLLAILLQEVPRGKILFRLLFYLPASITGLVAKENIVGTLGILYGGGDGSVYQNIAAAFNGISGYSFLVFNLLCAPCFAAIGAIKREMNSQKWTWFAIGYQCGFAYLCGLMIYQFGCAFTGNLNVIGLICAILALAGIIYMLVRPYKEATTLKA